jgi:hypothetical protein
MSLLEVFYVAPPADLPSLVQNTIDFLHQGFTWASRHLPIPYEDDYRQAIIVLKKLKECFTACNSMPERGMLLFDGKENFQVNIRPVLDFLKFMEGEGTSMRNFDLIESILVIYLHQDNIQEFKKVSTFIRNIETALYEYQN